MEHIKIVIAQIKCRLCVWIECDAHILINKNEGNVLHSGEFISTKEAFGYLSLRNGMPFSFCPNCASMWLNDNV